MDKYFAYPYQAFLLLSQNHLPSDFTLLISASSSDLLFVKAIGSPFDYLQDLANQHEATDIQ